MGAYFVAQDEKDEISAAVEREVAQVYVRAEQRFAEVNRSADAVITAMLELGVKRPEIASRLGISTRDVKRAAPDAPAASVPESDQPHTPEYVPVEGTQESEHAAA